MAQSLHRPGSLEYSDQAKALLHAADQLPVTIPERDRLITALDLIAGDEWLRVVLAVGAEGVDRLRVAATDCSENQFAQIMEVAESVSIMYGGDHVAVADIAVALAATARRRFGNLTDLISSSFGLGTLQDSERILNNHFDRLSEVNELIGDSYPESLGMTVSGLRGEKLATAFDTAARFTLFTLLVLLALRSEGWVPWIIALASPIATQNPRRKWQFTGVDSVPQRALPTPLRLPRLPTPWPLLPIISVAATGLGMWPQAWLTAVGYLLIGLIDYFGEVLQARAIRFRGPFTANYGVDREVIARLAGTFDRYGVRFQWIDFLIPLYTLPIVAASVIPITPTWPAIIFGAYFLGTRCFIPFVFSLLVQLHLFNGNVAPLAVSITAGLITLGLTTLHHRTPAKPVPVPWGPLRKYKISDYVTATQARRRLSIGRPEAALEIIDKRVRPGGHPIDLLGAYCLIETSRPGEATMRLGEGRYRLEYRDYIRCSAALQLGDINTARTFLNTSLNSSQYRSARLQYEWLFLIIRCDIASNTTTNTLATISKRIPRRITPDKLFTTMALLRLASLTCTRTDPTLSSMLAGLPLLLGRNQRLKGEAFNLIDVAKRYDQADRRRPLDIEVTRCTIIISVCALSDPRLRMGESMTSTVDTAQTACGLLFSLGLPMEGARAFEEIADVLVLQPEYRKLRLQFRCNAVAALNQARHELGVRSDRLTWWSTFSTSLESALIEAANGKDWRLVAELIEMGRLQEAVTSKSPRQNTLTPPYVRVAGKSRLETSLWQRSGTNPARYNLEDAAHEVLGSDTWWWSTWHTSSHVFWTLVRPNIPVTGGFFPVTDETELLSELHQALPFKKHNETEQEFFERAIYSPLISGPQRAERIFSRKLGQLLPTALCDALRGEDGLVRLAIAPSPRYGTVPWAALVVDRNGDDARLCEMASIALAPTISVLAQCVSDLDSIDEKLPISLAVINPTGDLDQAQLVLSSIPSTAKVLTAKDRPMPADLIRTLSHLAPASTLVYVGHIDNPEQGSSAGLVLFSNDMESVTTTLTPDRIEMQGACMPLQVLALGCSSSDIQNIKAGEWTTLGPSLLTHGAQRVIVTSFPIVDAAAFDIDLISKVGSSNLNVTLRQLQVRELKRWRAGGRLGAPVSWAGHSALGRFSSEPTKLRRLSTTVYAASALIEAVDRAAAYAHYRGASEVQPIDLWVWALYYGWHEETKAARQRLIGIVGLGVSFFQKIKYRQHTPVNFSTTGEMRVGHDTLRILKESTDLANAMHDNVVEADHVFCALLRQESALGLIGRMLFGWDARQPEVLATILRDRQRGFYETGQASTSYLMQEAVCQVYAALGVQDVPNEADQWWFTDRES